jgi:hypothetical protein
VNSTGSKVQYLHLLPAADMPKFSAAGPFKAIVVVDQAIEPERRDAICRWLAETGCLYMMAWGTNCGDWVTATEQANRAKLADDEDIPSEQLTIATAHENDALKDVFWFAKYTAMHPCHVLDNTIVLHLAATAREEELIAAFAEA